MVAALSIMVPNEHILPCAKNFLATVYPSESFKTWLRSDRGLGCGVMGALILEYLYVNSYEQKLLQDKHVVHGQACSAWTRATSWTKISWTSTDWELRCTYRWSSVYCIAQSITTLPFRFLNLFVNIELRITISSQKQKSIGCLYGITISISEYLQYCIHSRAIASYILHNSFIQEIPDFLICVDVKYSTKKYSTVEPDTRQFLQTDESRHLENTRIWYFVQEFTVHFWGTDETPSHNS